MGDHTPGFTRRNVLRAGGSVLGLGALGGMAGGVAEPGPVAVGYRGGAGRRAALDIASSVVYDYRFDAVAIEATAAGIAALRRRADVRYVEAPIEFETVAQTHPWGIDRIDADVAHDAGETGEGAHIAIIDTGIDNTHADLSSNLGPGATFQLGAQVPAQQDDNGHGSHCAGVAAAADDGAGVVGVRTKATLHGLKAFNATGTGVSMDIAAAIDHAAAEGYHVVNMSFGAREKSQVIEDACERAYSDGLLLVAAAGNSGPCEGCVAYPAAYPTVVAVSATTRDDGFAAYSSQGPEVELAAPGDEIYSTFLLGSYASLSGTSMAAPHVSGVGALLMAKGLTNEEARRRLGQTAEDLGLPSRKQGEGLVDAAAALGVDGGGGSTSTAENDTNTESTGEATDDSGDDSSGDSTEDAPEDDQGGGQSRDRNDGESGGQGNGSSDGPGESSGDGSGNDGGAGSGDGEAGDSGDDGSDPDSGNGDGDGGDGSGDDETEVDVSVGTDEVGAGVSSDTGL